MKKSEKKDKQIKIDFKDRKVLIGIIVICLIVIIFLVVNNIKNDNGEIQTDNSNSSEIKHGGANTDTNKKEEEKPKYDAATLEAEIQKQPVFVYSTRYEVQDDNYKCLYPDILIANVKNASGTSIKKVTVAFVGWDSNNFPVKVGSRNRQSYVSLADFDDVNLVDGATYNDTGLGLDCVEDSQIATFKAIVESYEDFNGTKWENPLYENWREIYENKQLQ